MKADKQKCNHPTCNGECRREKKPKVRKPIKKRSLKMIKAMKVYNVMREAFLSHNPACGVCGGIASQVHHKRGRIGQDLLDTRYWLSVCGECHEWIEQHPEQAKEMGYSLSRLNERA